MSRRTTLDVIADILRIASAPTSKTQLLYSANLSYAQTVKYIELLIELGMLNRITHGKNEKFVITEAGQAFLSKIQTHFGRISPGERSIWA